MKTTKIIFFLLYALCSSSSHAQLNGTARKNVIEGYQKSCYATQRQGSPNANLNDITLIKYCHCAANYIADLMNEPLLRDIEAGRIKPKPIWNQMAADYCRINFEKY
jgi:hypothetical protein